MKLVLSVLGTELLRVELNESDPPEDHSQDDLGSTVASSVEAGPRFGFGHRPVPGDVEA